jgi:hypothetical protein
MTDPLLRGLVRKERAERAADEIGSCGLPSCGSRVDVTDTPDGVRCYEHRAGPVATVEADHVAGVVNLAAFTVALRANDHRRVETIRVALGMDRWPDAPDGDPLVRLAHLLGGLATLLWLAAEWLVGYVAAGRERAPAPAFPFA